VNTLAEKYFLSPKSIQRIISKQKKEIKWLLRNLGDI
jgi:hypothetical protein